MHAQIINTHVVLDVGLAACPQQHAAALVVAVLAAEVERGEAAAVPQVVVALAHLAQELAGAAEALPGGLVERSVAVLQCEKDRVESLDFSNIFMQKFVKLYNLGPPLIRDVLFCFLPEVPVPNWAAQ